jgi:hypothetical protein
MNRCICKARSLSVGGETPLWLGNNSGAKVHLNSHNADNPDKLRVASEFSMCYGIAHEAWALIPGRRAVVFIDNHDTQRGRCTFLQYSSTAAHSNRRVAGAYLADFRALGPGTLLGRPSRGGWGEGAQPGSVFLFLAFLSAPTIENPIDGSSGAALSRGRARAIHWPMQADAHEQDARRPDSQKSIQKSLPRALSGPPGRPPAPNILGAGSCAWDAACPRRWPWF